MFKEKKGLTLIEIMVVTTIIVLLATIAIPNLLRARLAANDSSAKATLKSISTALESYMNTEQVYPSETTSLIGVSPPYLSTDYFVGNHSGFTFTATLTSATYSVTAEPASANLGSASFTISTGGTLVEN